MSTVPRELNTAACQMWTVPNQLMNGVVLSYGTVSIKHGTVRDVHSMKSVILFN